LLLFAPRSASLSIAERIGYGLFVTVIYGGYLTWRIHDWNRDH
jgi:hypothetical protein